MKKALFIDRDGTIVREPSARDNYQLDRLDLFHFVPGAIGALKNLCGLGYEFVLVSNQDGLGTSSFPEETFWPCHNLMLETLEGEGIVFDDQLIDRHFPEDGSNERKPGTGMFRKYLGGEYNLAESFVIGDRDSDMQLAENLGAKGLRIDPQAEARSWQEAVLAVRSTCRTATVERKTRETDLRIHIDLDNGRFKAIGGGIDTGLKFFDHMLDQIAHHGGVGLEISCKGDLEVDEHHSIEDVGIALGEAILKALGDKAGIERYGFALPMDECRAIVLLDFGGRPELVWDVEFTREYVGDVPTEMFEHFFKSLSTAMKANLYVQAAGKNNHHLAESIFKAFARTLRQAVSRNVFSYELPSSKGVL